jgi:RNA polymerase sigma-70 factor, ECF subfamily
MGSIVNEINSSNISDSPSPMVGNDEACGQAHGMDIKALYCQYHRRVFGWCFSMVRNSQDAEDLTQEAFVQIIRKIHTFRGEAALSTWLYRVVTNTALMWLRRRGLPQTSLDEDIGARERNLWHGNVVRSAGRILKDSNARIDLERAVYQLPLGFKTVFVLHDVEGYRHREIAAMMGCSVGCSKSKLHKAHRRLRKLLDDSSHSPRLIARSGARW